MKTQSGILLLACLGITLSRSEPSSLVQSPESDAFLANPSDTPNGIPASDWSQIRAAYESSRHRISKNDDGGLNCRNPGQQWTTTFDGRGYLTHPDTCAWQWGLALTSYGFPDAKTEISGRAAVSHKENRIEYAWDSNLTEWFINDARGLEQGWTLSKRPPTASNGRLEISLSVQGGLIPEVASDGSSVSFNTSEGVHALNWGGLKAWDADGKTLDVRCEPNSERAVTITVDETDALYPITIDPIAQQANLTASNAGLDDSFGCSVAISGNTVVVGARAEDSSALGVNGDQTSNATTDSGAAYVFIRGTNGLWSQQAYLKASNPQPYGNFGSSVSISSDTILIGAPGESSSAIGINSPNGSNGTSRSGAAYIFTRIGTLWTQQAYAKASNTTTVDEFGSVVAIHDNTVVIGAPFEDSIATGVNGDQSSNTKLNSGAAYVLFRSGNTWIQQAYLKASNTDSSDQFGSSVGVFENSVIVGSRLEASSASGINGNQADNALANSGAAYVFTRSGTTWSQQAYLKGPAPPIAAQFGASVALSGDTALVGAPGGTGAGTAHVFTRSGSTWSLQSSLVASNPDSGDSFGSSVALDGDKAIVGAKYEASNSIGVNGPQLDNSHSKAGAAYVFIRNAGNWVQQGYLKSSPSSINDVFGSAVALSGNLAIVGSPFFNPDGTSAGRSEVFALNAGSIMEVRQPSDQILTSQVDEIKYDKTLINVTNQPNRSKDFTISNAGQSDLTGLVITISGPDASTFSLDSATTSLSLAPGANTLFNVSYDPSYPGIHTASLRITSTNPDIAPFEVILTGSAQRVDDVIQEEYAKGADTAASDFFGYSVAIDGDTAAIGAPRQEGEFDSGDTSSPWLTDSGALYVFIRSGSSWSQQAYIKAPKSNASCQFGWSVALHDDTIVVGAIGENSSATGVNGTLSTWPLADTMGAAYVYVRNGTTWTLEAYLKASNTARDDIFGYAVAVHGNTVAVSAPGEDSNATGTNGVQTNNSASSSGAVYVFQRNGTQWAQEAYIKASNTGANDGFGNALSLSSESLVVSAPGEDSNSVGINGIQSNNSAVDSGAVYVFSRLGTTWTQEAYIKSSNSQTGDQFGASVSIDGDTLAVGAVQEDSLARGVDSDQSDNSASSSGAVYVFNRISGTWSQQSYVKSSNSDPGDYFGKSVSLSGQVLVVGSNAEDGSGVGFAGDNSRANSGASYVFYRNGNAWHEGAYLKSSFADEGDQFGSSVSVSGSTIMVGAPFEDGGSAGIDGNEASNSAQDSGAAYFFKLPESPRISLYDPSGRQLNSWNATTKFEELIEAPPQAKVFRIYNPGNVAITGLQVSLDGADAVSFSLDTTGTSTDLAPGASTTFSVTLSPDMPTTYRCAVHIASNDPDDSPFDIPIQFRVIRAIDVLQQTAYLKASNTNQSDYFTRSVAADLNTIVVGASGESSSGIGVNGNQNDNSAGSAGAAYVFVRDGSGWRQEAYLKASNAEAGDLFGWSVAISGDTIVVGARGEGSGIAGVNGDESNNSAISSGAAYVFVRNGGVWAQQAYLKASNPDFADSFGSSVAISADRIVVGAVDERSSAVGINGNQLDNSAQQSGAAYVFVRNATTWTQEAYLKASNSEYQDSFGGAVSISGDTIVVGASGEDSNSIGINGHQLNSEASNSGAAYVFSHSGGTWSQQAYLKASNTGANDFFGGSVSISGDRLVVGAGNESSASKEINGNQSDNTAASAGACYVFSRSGTTWKQDAYLKAPNAEAGDYFGGAVSISGQWIAVSASGEDSGATGIDGDTSDNSMGFGGAAYTFEFVESKWTHKNYFKASNTESMDSFGGSVAISGSFVVVGAASEDSSATGVNGYQSDNSAPASGAAYVFSGIGLPTIGIREPNGGILANSGSGFDFPDTATGTDSEAVEFDIVNTGNGVLTGISITGFGDNPEEFQIDQSETESVLDVGQVTSFKVTFTPSVLGPRSARIRIRSNDAENSPYEIDLRGNGVPPAPEISVKLASGPELIDGVSLEDFGTVAFSLTGEWRTFEIRNVGTAPLSGITAVVGGSNGADFQLDAGAMSKVLAPGSRTSFSMRFVPTATGSRTATLALASNDEDENPFNLTLTGNGIPAVSIADVSVNENAGSVQIPVTLSGAAGTETQIPWATADDTAVSPAEYLAASGTLIIPAGQTSGVITIQLVDDTLPEPDKTFRVDLQSASNAVIIKNQALVTIDDNELVRMSWDGGLTDLGNTGYNSPTTATGSYYFRIQTQGSAQGGWRTSLRVASGQANLYLRKGALPTTSNYQYRSILTGSDGIVLRPDQYVEGEVWYALVQVTSAGNWSLTSGEIFVEDLGSLGFTDDDSDGAYDIGEPIQGSGGTRTLPPEGIRFFRQSVPSGVPAWVLWLNGGNRSVAVRRGKVPFQPTTSPSYEGVYDKLQPQKMLLVPPYLGSGQETYFLSVSGTAGETINLDSRIQTVETVAFDAAGLAVNTTPTGPDDERTAAPYRSYRVKVPINTLAWDVAMTPSSGDSQIAIGKLDSNGSGQVISGVPNEFDNIAFSEVPGTVTDSLTLVPQTLTNGTWFITVYGNAAFEGTLKQGHPTVSTIPFYSADASDVTNDLPTRAGWRYYQVRDLLSQVGTLGWELSLANQVPGSEIAVRRNAVPGRWNQRSGASAQNPGTGNEIGYVDSASSNGLLQLPGHQSDIWYVGVYTPQQPLGPFILSRSEITPPVLAFDGTVAADTVTGHALNTWKYFRFDVPADSDILGWDVKLNATAGSPQMVIARDLLPISESTTVSTINNVWNSGEQWAANRDWTGGSSERIVASMGRPLEPGTYYVGVLAQGTVPNAYSINNRAIGTNSSSRSIKLQPTLPFSNGGNRNIANLQQREAAYIKVTVPPNQPSWQVKLTVTSGEMMLATLKDVLPNSNAGTSSGNGVVMQKFGNEWYHILPTPGESSIPSGDYYFAVVSESATASGTFQSVGAMPIVNWGTASQTPSSRAVTVTSGEIKHFRFTVPAGSAAMEIRLEGSSGQPAFRINEGTSMPTPYNFSDQDGYGYEGGGSWQGGGESGAIHTKILNFNPAPITYTVSLRGSPFIPSGSGGTIVFKTLPVVDLPMNGGSSAITAQEPGTWRLFRTTVPVNANLLGWDVWVKNVTGGDPEMKVRRDLIPDSASGDSSLPSADAWPSGGAWPVTSDWTHRSFDPGNRNVQSHRVMASSGRPLVPGTYYVAVLGSGNAASNYTLQSRGIGQPGSGMDVELTDTVSFNGGTTTVSNLPAREAAYIKVTVPPGQASWQVRLTPTSGEMMLSGARGVLPNSYAGLRGLNGAIFDDAGMTASKVGEELYHLLPSSGNTIPSGDYYFAIVSEGANPPDGNTAGSGTASGLFESLGPIPVTNLGQAAPTPTTTPVILSGGQIKLYRFDIAAGTAAVELRLSNQVNNPGFTVKAGTDLPRPYVRNDNYSYDFYGYEGGHSDDFAGTGIITIPNPTPGNYTVTVRAAAATSGNIPYPASSANLVIKTVPVADLALNGSSTNISSQELDTWRYFRVTVPAGVLGWDLWLKNLAANGSPRMEIRRDLLPLGPQGNDVGINDSVWPYGGNLSVGSDWTGYSSEADGSTNRDSRMVVAMGRPLEPGTYYIGVQANGSASNSYNLQSRGIGEAGSGQAIEVAASVNFAGGTSSVTGLSPHEATYFKVTVPSNQASWQIRLQPGSGEMMMAGRFGGIPTSSPAITNSPFNSGGFETQKSGDEWYQILPSNGQTTITSGTYYFAVISEGIGPVGGKIGTDASSGTFRSVGTMLVTNLGQIGTTPSVNATSLAGGESKLYSFTVAPGTDVLEIRLDNRVGNLLYAIRQGSSLVNPPAASNDFYGYSGGTIGSYTGSGIHTINRPTSGTYMVTLRAAFPLDPATATLVVRSKAVSQLNFAESLNDNGKSHTDTRSLLGGERAMYAVDVPVTLGADEVIGWRLDVANLLGNASLKIFPDLNNPDSNSITVSDKSAIIVPPYLTPGTRWYVEVVGGGLTEYQIASSPVTRRNTTPWAMPLAFNTSFGDSTDIDIGEDEWHFYAVDVPEGNPGILRTVLEAPNGNPQLYIREDGVPTLSHSRYGITGGSLVDRRMIGSGTEYGNWVPLNGRTENQLRPGRWYLGVKAESSHARYRLQVTTGTVSTLPLISGYASGQSLAAGDWRYYQVSIPENAPNNWNLNFGQQIGDIVMHLRDTLLPGQDSENTGSYLSIRNAADDYKNQGPYSDEGYDAAGVHNFSLPPLRPGQSYFVGFRAKNDAVFSLTSSVSGGTLGTVPELAFANGNASPTIPAGGHFTYQVKVPLEATVWKHLFSRPPGVDLRIENGTLPQLTGPGVHYLNPENSPELEQQLGAWPWVAGHTYYLSLVNTTASPQAVNLQMGSSTGPPNQAFADSMTASGLTGNNALPNAVPFHDGVSNLLKYAFNMNLAGPDTSGLTPGTGSSGLPSVTITGVGDSGVLRVEFVRRLGSGLIYTPKKSSSLNSGSFTQLSVTPVITPIGTDGLWKRVIYEEPVNLNTTPTCFGVVEVRLP